MNQPSPHASDQTQDRSSSDAQPLLTHEKSLTAKIAKGSEADDIYEQQVLMLGTQLVTQLSVLVKTSRIHGPTNSALDLPVETILTVIKTLAGEEPIAVRLQNDFIFLGRKHLKVTSQLMLVFATVIDTFNAWRVGAVWFAPAVTSQDIRVFVNLLVALDPKDTGFSGFQQSLRDNNVTTIEVEESRTLRAGVASRTARVTAKDGYARTAEAIGSLTKNVREGGGVGFKQAKRAIQNIVDLMMKDESALLGLTTLRCHDQYTHNHSVNVALLSMALGNRAGYPKTDLADLGLAALFHDMGKSTIPLDVLNKPGEFSQEDWSLMKSHPTEGVLSLAKLRGLTNLPGRMASASFEHHMNLDFSGYPKLKSPWRLSLTGRILMIADCYDAMTSSRVYRREPISPSKVLDIMFKKSGQSFDAVLLKLFVNCVGIIPIGSLVMLDTNELAIVLKPAQNPSDAERPFVKVITDTQGSAIDDGRELDLSEKDATGHYRNSIFRLVDNTEHKFDTSRYFV
jgi:HD-GYP domain-containing protein (c-di-GMP phosphodiesterase class II)